jgi:uncharacterized protein
MLPISSIGLAFVSGLTSGGFSCLAVQGGFLGGVLANSENKKRSLFLFLTGKLVGNMALGALLGLIGSSLLISTTTQAWLQIAVGVFMLATAAHLAGVHPIFRYTQFSAPHFITKRLRGVPGSSSSLAAGALTVFIPCGVTQSMMLLAISTSSALSGALVMGSFVIATLPQFIALGALSGAVLSRPALRYVAALVVAFLGITTINTGQVLRGSVHTFQNYGYVLGLNRAQSVNAAEVVAGFQQINMSVSTSGYEVDKNVVKAGYPVRISFDSQGTVGCARSFSIPSLGITKLLPEKGQEELVFTPDKPGLLTYSCNMGMHVGSITVI